MKSLLFLVCLAVVASASGLPSGGTVNGPVQSLIGTIRKSFGGIVEGFVRAGQTGLNGAVDVFSGVVKGGTAIGGSIASGVTSTITGAVVQSAESLNDIGNTIRQTIESAINPIKSGFATSLRGLLDFLRERFPFLGSLVGRFASGGAGGSGRGGTSASVGGTAGVGTKKGRGGLGLSLGM